MTDEPLNHRNKNGITRQPAALYALFYADMREAARQLGYALALHGSMQNDLDVVAVPWVDGCADPDVLVAAMAEVSGGYVATDREGGPPRVATKPHGRRTWTIYLGGGAGYIDLSIMPRQSVAPVRPVCDVCGPTFIGICPHLPRVSG